MIVLDTNVLSELMRSEPARAVLRWFGTQPAARLFTTAISEGEILYGLTLLSSGRRRIVLERAARQVFAEDFADRVLPFDRAAAHEFAEIAADRHAAGRPMSEFDAQIAAISRAHGAALATRNARDFDGCGIEVIDPWRT